MLPGVRMHHGWKKRSLAASVVAVVWFGAAATGTAGEAQKPAAGASLTAPFAGSARVPLERRGPSPRRDIVRRSDRLEIGVSVRPGRVVSAFAAPRGTAPLALVGERTEFGSRRVLPVVARSHGWLRVLGVSPGGAAGWVRWSDDRLELRPLRWELVVDRSRNELTVLRAGHAVRRLAVGLGRAGSTTPLGRFSVTDKLSGAPYRGAYGCCIVALSGRQPNLPTSWTGGDRLAIHASGGTGGVSNGSAGCVVGSNEDLAWLTRRVPLGTVVTVRE